MLHVTIGGTEYTEVVTESVVVSEAIGRPTSASFRLEDMDSTLAVAGWLPSRLADVRLYDDDGNLFRGQVVAARASVEGVRRVLEIDAEGYERLLDQGLVGTNLAQYVHIIRYTDATISPGYVFTREGDLYWVDADANTGIAYPAQDDSSVVQALISTYWAGPTLTYDITSYGDVDQGASGSVEDTEGRTFFDQTSLRDALDRTASLISGRLAYWIDADLVFHWRVLTGHTWTGYTAVPTGSALHTLPRLFPEYRVPPLSPYGLVAGDANSIPAKLGVDATYAQAVDSVYVRAGVAEASGWETVATGTTGAKAFISAPWVTSTAERPTAVGYAWSEWSERVTYTVEATGPWTGIHVGQSMTIYSPTLGVVDATTQPIMANEMRFLPDGNRTYSLQLGDGPIRTMTAYTKPSARQALAVEGKLPDPITLKAARWIVEVGDVAPPAGTSQAIYAVYSDDAGNPLPIAGVRLNWGLTITEGSGTPYDVSTASVTNADFKFYLGLSQTVTQKDGRSMNALITGPSVTSDDSCIVWVEIA